MVLFRYNDREINLLRFNDFRADPAVITRAKIQENQGQILPSNSLMKSLGPRKAGNNSSSPYCGFLSTMLTSPTESIWGGEGEHNGRSVTLPILGTSKELITVASKHLMIVDLWQSSRTPLRQGSSIIPIFPDGKWRQMYVTFPKLHEEL